MSRRTKVVKTNPSLSAEKSGKTRDANHAFFVFGRFTRLRPVKHFHFPFVSIAASPFRTRKNNSI